MILKKLLGLPDLMKAQTFHIYESTKFVVVSQDKSFVLAAFQIVYPSFESLNDCYDGGSFNLSHLQPKSCNVYPTTH